MEKLGIFIFMFLLIVSCSEDLGKEAERKYLGCFTTASQYYSKFITKNKFPKMDEEVLSTSSDSVQNTPGASSQNNQDDEVRPRGIDYPEVYSFLPKGIFQSNSKLVIAALTYENCAVNDLKSFVSFPEDNEDTIIVKYKEYYKNKDVLADCNCTKVVETTYEDDDRDLSKIKYVQNDRGGKKVLKK